MASNSTTSASSASIGPPPKSIEDIYEEASASVAAETLLQAMQPQLKKGMELRLMALFNSPPELGPLLDARAQLRAIYDIQLGLERDVKKGRGAVQVMTNLLIKSA